VFLTGFFPTAGSFACRSGTLVLWRPTKGDTAAGRDQPKSTQAPQFRGLGSLPSAPLPALACMISGCIISLIGQGSCG